MLHLLILGRRFFKDVIYSNHLGKNGAIAERVAQCSQPGGEIAQNSHNFLVGGGVGGRDDEEIDIHVQDNSSTCHQVVQVGAAHTYQPVGRTLTTYHTSILHFEISNTHEKEQSETAGSCWGLNHACRLQPMNMQHSVYMEDCEEIHLSYTTVADLEGVPWAPWVLWNSPFEELPLRILSKFVQT